MVKAYLAEHFQVDPNYTILLNDHISVTRKKHVYGAKHLYIHPLIQPNTHPLTHPPTTHTHLYIFT